MKIILFSNTICVHVERQMLKFEPVSPALAGGDGGSLTDQPNQPTVKFNERTCLQTQGKDTNRGRLPAPTCSFYRRTRAHTRLLQCTHARARERTQLFF